MKPNEIMVGNLVHCITDNTNCRIAEISVLDRAEMLGHPYYRTEEGAYNFLSDIEGIPLAKDILEKNFPTHHHGYFDTYKVNDEIMIEDRSDFMKESYFCVCQGNYPTASYWTCTIQYVHQLQNVLALHGIEKEIEL